MKKINQVALNINVPYAALKLYIKEEFFLYTNTQLDKK